jgi:hypothetical protein
MKARQLDAEPDTISVAEPRTVIGPDPQMTEPDAPLPPRVLAVAMIIAESIARQLRESQSGNDE